MHIAICDDEELYRKAVVSSVEQWKTMNMAGNIDASCYTSTEDLLDDINKGKVFDIVFLDIQIPGEISGLELAKHIRIANDTVTIVFITNYAEYACAGYRVNALRYIQKPVKHEQIAECLDIVNAQCKSRQSDTIVLSSSDQKIVLHYGNIMFFGASGHYIQVHEAVGTDSVKTRLKIKDILRLLPANTFAQCHRCFAVNMMYVRKITRTEITLSNGIAVPIGAKYAEDVKKVFLNYYQGVML